MREELDVEALKLLEETGQASMKHVAEIRQQYANDGTDFSLLASRAAKRAATAALETIKQMLVCIAAEEPCDTSVMEVILKEELQNFRYYARQDLGIDA